jgi:GH18 family chitinase
MAKCDTCGNDYAKTFQVTTGNRTMTFDSFECAIQAMAPQCSHADAALSVMGWKLMAGFSAATTARRKKGSRAAIGFMLSGMRQPLLV